MVKTIHCTNGSLKDDSKTATCDEDDKTSCFPDSYKYCKKFTSSQIAIIVSACVLGIIIIGIANWVLSFVPILGGIAKIIINFVLLVGIAAGVYVMYMDFKA